MDILESIRVASPCSADWNEMHGDDKRRFCGQCRLHVYYLPGMRGEEVEGLLLEAECRVCVRLYERADGTVITRDCPVGLAAARLRIRRTVTAVTSLVVSFLVAIGSSRIVHGPAPEGPPIPSPARKKEDSRQKITFGGMVANLDEIKTAILRRQDET